MWGFAVGLVAYRYAVLPFLWSSPWRHVVIGVAAGLLVGGRALLRRRDGGLGGLVLAGILAAGAGFGAGYAAFPSLSRAPLTTRSFPGFSIDLPRGETVEDQSAGYATGKLIMKNIAGSGSVSLLIWNVGGEMTADDMKMVAKVLSAAMPGIPGTPHVTTVPGPEGKPSQSIVYEGDDAVFEVSSLVCGARQFVIATGGQRGSLALHARIVASFSCRPDPERDAKEAVFSFTIELDLPGWYASDRDPEAFEITDGKTATLTLRTMPSGMKVDLEHVLQPMFEAAGVTEGLEVGQKLPDGRVPFKLSADGETSVGWAAMFPCANASGLVIAVAWDHETDDALYDKLAAAKCMRPGAPPQTWPDPPVGATP
jgi:hypothetical protein